MQDIVSLSLSFSLNSVMRRKKKKKDTIAARRPLRAVCESIFLGKQSLLVSCDVTQITTFAAAARSWSLHA